MQRAPAHIVGIDLHATSIAAHNHIAQLVVEASVVEMHTVPLTTHDVVTNLANDMIEAVATHCDGSILSAFSRELAFDKKRSLVVEEQSSTGVDCHVYQSVDFESAINQIRFTRSEMRWFGKGGIVKYYHILSPCCDCDFLSHTVGDKLDIIFQEFRLLLIGRVKTALDKHKDAVIAPHFNIVELIALDSVNIQEEMPLALAGNFYR